MENKNESLYDIFKNTHTVNYKNYLKKQKLKRNKISIWHYQI